MRIPQPIYYTIKSLQKFRKMYNCEGQFYLNNYKQYSIQPLLATLLVAY